MKEDKYRAILRQSFSVVNEVAEASLKMLIKKPILENIEEWEAPFVLFEFNDSSPYGVTELHVQDDYDWVLEIPEDAEEDAWESDFEALNIEHDEIVNWFADRWAAVGSCQYSPAFVQFHWGTGFYAFDLEERVWKEEWPKTT